MEMHIKILHKIIQYLKKKKRRLKNQKHVSDYPFQSSGWTKYVNNPVIDYADLGTIFDPFVRVVDDKYIMCVSRRANDSLMLFSSDNGTEWREESTVLYGVNGSKWESSVNRGCFLIKDGIWYLWYTGQSDGKSCIGLATSEDGSNFKRIQENPVISPELYHEGISVMNPCVIWDEEKNIFKMWYAAGENYEPDVLCFAQSEDGIRWKKNQQPIMAADSNYPYKAYKIGACDIIKLNNQYYMAYIVYQNLDVARISLAKSKNGVSGWSECENKPILGPQKKAWDGHSVYKPTLCLSKEKTSVFLWYNGRYKTRERIGMATLSLRKEEIE